MSLAKNIVNAVLHNLLGRSGIGNELDMIDEDVMEEIHDTLEEIVEREIKKYEARTTGN